MDAVREIYHSFSQVSFRAFLVAAPALRLPELEDAVHVQVEVPGFSANDLQVSLAPGQLTIIGTKKSSKESQDKGKQVYQEKCCSELLRVIDLPVEVDTTSVVYHNCLY